MARDQVVLLTGTSSGMGKITALTLARKGYKVFAGIRDARGRNAAAAAELKAACIERPIEIIEMDVTSDDSVASGIASLLARAGRIDVLVNCAGVMWTGVTEAFSSAQLQRILDTNLVGPFRVMKAVLPHMRTRRSGCLITITSTCGRTWPPGFGIYCASKSGMEALAEVLGYEVSGFGIDTVIIEPGPFQTNLQASQQPPEDQGVVAQYGEHGKFDERVGQAVWPVVAKAGVEVTNPQLVADLVVELIETPPGKRPIRTTVGLDFGTGDMNRASAPHQEHFLSLLGVSDLRRVPS